MQHIPNVAAWLFASVAAFAYECSTSAGLERESRFGPSGVRSWWSARLQPHPAISAFVSYWAGGMRDAARSRLLKHVRRCPLCHLEWSLAGAARAGIVPEDGMLEGRTREIRAQLENDLKRCDLGSLAAMLREHNKRLNVLLTSELEMFFGAAAASHWSFTEEPRRTFASPLITEFLGGTHGLACDDGAKRLNFGMTAAGYPRNDAPVLVRQMAVHQLARLDGRTILRRCPG